MINSKLRSKVSRNLYIYAYFLDISTLFLLLLTPNRVVLEQFHLKDISKITLGFEK